MQDQIRELTPTEVTGFIEQGFVKIEGAFSQDLAEEARSILWRDTGCNPDDPSTWTKPVVRLGFYSQPPFAAAANTLILRRAFDRLVGVGRWLPRENLGTFPIRFPSSEDPGDAGWHVDASFGTENPDFMSWRVNVHSKGRALLMLFLFSDVGPDDAPTGSASDRISRWRGSWRQRASRDTRSASSQGMDSPRPHTARS